MRKLSFNNIMFISLCFIILPYIFKCNLETHDCENFDPPCTEQGTCTDFGYCICDDGFEGFDCSTSKTI